MQLTSGTILGGRYRIIEPIARSPLATVHLAVDQTTNEMLAIKVISREADERGEFSKRFRREAKILSELRSEFLTRIIEFGVEEKYLYIVMEFLPGKTVAQLLKERGPFEELDCLQIAQQVSEALKVLQSRGIIHRDIKPSNIMVMPDRRVKLLDFGIALDLTKVTSQQLTGTLAYLSPEQTDPSGKPPDIRSDIYSLGATMYEMLAGRPPFAGTNLLQLARAIVMDPPVPIRNYREDIRPEVESLVIRCIAKAPSARYATPTELSEAIRQVSAQPGPQTLYSRADEAFKNEDWRRVVELCDKIIDKYPSFREARDLKQQALRRQEEDYRKSLERLLALAEEFARNQKWNDVIQVSNQILGMDAKNDRARELLAEARRKQQASLPRLVSPSGKQFFLKARSTLVGRRDPKGATQPPDVDLGSEEYGRTVSRSHARILNDSGDWLLLPERTTNITLVNGEKVELESQRHLRNGDKIQFGGVTVAFYVDGNT